MIVSHATPTFVVGSRCLKGTRVTMRTILASLAEGARTEQIFKAFPILTKDVSKLASL